ncbi:MAG: hypothetical protein JW959_13265, partial [Pirellulales bacterium]|nr:hypothetical protein [Pirellulales bacterium]
MPFLRELDQSYQGFDSKSWSSFLGPLYGALTLVGRKSRFLLLSRVGDLRAATIRQSAAESNGTTPPALRKTLTLDNGKEFAEHQQLEADAGLKTHFAKAYCA